MPTTQTSREEEDCKCSYLLFLSCGHNFKLFLIQIMEPINEIPQCPAKGSPPCTPGPWEPLITKPLRTRLVLPVSHLGRLAMWFPTC